MCADQRAGFMGINPTRLAYTFALPSYKKGNTSTPQTCSIDKTYRDVSTLGESSPLPVTLKGPSQPGECCRALIWLGTSVRLGPTPGFPSAFDEGAPVFGCGHSWMNLSKV
jgi:hypothetical protein